MPKTVVITFSDEDILNHHDAHEIDRVSNHDIHNMIRAKLGEYNADIDIYNGNFDLLELQGSSPQNEAIIQYSNIISKNDIHFSESNKGTLYMLMKDNQNDMLLTICGIDDENRLEEIRDRLFNKLHALVVQPRAGGGADIMVIDTKESKKSEGLIDLIKDLFRWLKGDNDAQR